MIKKFLQLMILRLTKEVEHLDICIKSMKNHSYLESHYINIGKQLFEIANCHITTEEHMIENCKTFAEFADITTIQDIEKYLFLNRERGLVRYIVGNKIINYTDEQLTEFNKLKGE